MGGMEISVPANAYEGPKYLMFDISPEWIFRGLVKRLSTYQQRRDLVLSTNAQGLVYSAKISAVEGINLGILGWLFPRSGGRVEEGGLSQTKDGLTNEATSTLREYLSQGYSILQTNGLRALPQIVRGQISELEQEAQPTTK